MSFVINPGTEPVEGATYHNAALAMERFIKELNIPRVMIRRSNLCEHRGRFLFVLGNLDNGVDCEIKMPGCDPDLTAKSKPWESPRLYVDGSSWLWDFGLNIARHRLSGGQDD